MSVKTKLARQAVKTTAKHTAHGAAAKAARKPFRSVTLLAIGALAGALVGWLVGRSGSSDNQLDPIAQAPAPPSVVNNSNSTEKASETGAVS
jgi:ABC-type nitrate/sulfonate/bicarbonate transport system permease component